MLFRIGDFMHKKIFFWRSKIRDNFATDPLFQLLLWLYNEIGN